MKKNLFLATLLLLVSTSAQGEIGVISPVAA
jgi:hypothetical protein